MRYEFSFPGKPPSKGRPRSTKTGIVYTPKETRLREATVLEYFLHAFPGAKPLEGPLLMEVQAHFTPPKSARKKDRLAMLAGKMWPTKKPDTDNIAKVIMDGLQGRAFFNDSQIVKLRVSKLYGPLALTNVLIKRVGEE